MNLEKLKEKLSDPKYNNSGLDPVQLCSSSCNFSLKDHAEGWCFWKTTFGEDNPGNRVDTLFLNENEIVFACMEQYPGKIKKVEIKVIEEADIRNLEPITSEEFEKIFTEIVDYLENLLLVKEHE